VCKCGSLERREGGNGMTWLPFRNSLYKPTEMLVDYTGAGVTMDIIHKLVHLGNMHEMYYEDLDLDNNETVSGTITTGSKTVHLVFDIEVYGGRVVFEVYEGATVSAVGTEVPSVAFNRDNVQTPDVKFYSAPTVTNDGTLIVKKSIFASTDKKVSLLTNTREGIERIFKANTIYLFKIIGTTDNTLFSFDVQFYEV